MKLVSAHVTNYRSILDSNSVRIGQSTCLVGKNEAGKTAFLKALEGINSTDEVMQVIDEALERADLSDAAASRLAVGNYSLIKNMRSARSRDKRYSYHNLKALAGVLGLELYFGPPREEGRIYTTEIAGDDFTPIPRYDAQLAAGGGAFNEEGEPTSTLAFRRDWLARTGISPASACILSVRGDSMRPTLYDADLVMIDMRRKQVRNRRIYAFVDRDGEARVKRLEAIPGRMILLLSDNPDHETELREGPDMDSLQMLGEVVWSAHTWLDQPHVNSPEVL